MKKKAVWLALVLSILCVVPVAQANVVTVGSVFNQPNCATSCPDYVNNYTSVDLLIQSFYFNNVGPNGTSIDVPANVTGDDIILGCYGACSTVPEQLLGVLASNTFVVSGVTYFAASTAWQTQVFFPAAGSGPYDIDINATPVSAPEPTALGLLASGLVGLGFLFRKRS
jgi:hypothetical protein